jgi:hypothetical protein
MTDQNWLLSTVAQSSAELIVIIGGFIINRILTLSSEQNGKTQKKNEIEISLNELNQANAGNEFKVKGYLTELFYLQNKEAIFANLENPEFPDFEGFLKVGLEKNELENIYLALVNKVKQVFVKLQAEYPATSNIPLGPQVLDSLAACKEAGFVIDSSIDETILLGIVPMYFEEQRSRYRLSSNWKSGGTKYVSLFAQIKSEELRELLEIRRRYSAERAAYSAQSKLLESDLESLGKPKGLIGGISVLTLFGLLGMILPVFMMTKRPVPSSSTSRDFVFWSFLAGFLVLAAYFVYSLRLLSGRDFKKVDNSSDIPDLKCE